jgi:selenocysteine lyase/cysteine desulfurase
MNAAQSTIYNRPPPLAPAMHDPLQSLRLLDAARQDFPGAGRWIYLQTAARGLMPLPARDAALRHLEARVHDGGDEGAMREAAARVRGKLARLIGAGDDEIVLVKDTSEGLNAVIASFPWQLGDNAVICREIEHPDSIYALYNVRDLHGAKVLSVRPTTDKATPLPTIARAIDKLTRVVIASTVSHVAGTRTDVAALGRICRDRGVFFMADGAQSVGALQINVRDECVDGLTAGASRFLCGPHGLGFLYVRREWAQRLRPSWLAHDGVDLGNLREGEQGGERYRPARGARRFDLGGCDHAAVCALEASLDLIERIGVRTIENHVLALAQRLTDGLRALELPLLSGRVPAHLSHVVVIGETRPSARTAAWLNSLYGHLEGRRVKLSVRHGRLRLALHLYNTYEDVETVVGLIRDWLKGNPAPGASRA